MNKPPTYSAMRLAITAPTDDVDPQPSAEREVTVRAKPRRRKPPFIGPKRPVGRPPKNKPVTATAADDETKPRCARAKLCKLAAYRHGGPQSAGADLGVGEIADSDAGILSLTSIAADLPPIAASHSDCVKMRCQTDCPRHSTRALGAALASTPFCEYASQRGDRVVRNVERHSAAAEYRQDKEGSDHTATELRRTMDAAPSGRLGVRDRALVLAPPLFPSERKARLCGLRRRVHCSCCGVGVACRDKPSRPLGSDRGVPCVYSAWRSSPSDQAVAFTHAGCELCCAQPATRCRSQLNPARGAGVQDFVRDPDPRRHLYRVKPRDISIWF